jgi:hypothetical protein
LPTRRTCMHDEHPPEPDRVLFLVDAERAWAQAF